MLLFQMEFQGTDANFNQASRSDPGPDLGLRGTGIC